MKLYGVSVGCGDYELMTLKSVRILNQCNIIAVPRTHRGNTMALDIIKNVIDIKNKEIVYLDFKMSLNNEDNKKQHIKNADIICDYLKKSDVAMISIGDISVFSTFSYIMDIALSKGCEVEIIPGVPSFCAAAAAAKESLTVINKPFMIIPAPYSNIDNICDYDGTMAIMKRGKSLDHILNLFKDREYTVVQNCGLDNEIIYKKGEDRFKLSDSYFTTILVKDE